ncbi:unnamed protein product [Brassica rapa subsp. trilocularis]
MEAKGGIQWSSIIVPSVQEMVEVNLISTVPPRYVRSDLDKAEIDSDLTTEIPIINMNLLCSSTSMDSEIDKLDSACKEWGFFQANSSFLDKIKSEIQDFFNLPMTEKKNLWQRPGEIEGFGQAFVVSEEQKLDWGDMFFITMQPLHLRKPHLFPKLAPPFRDTLEKYSDEVKSIAKILLAKMARALEIKPEEMEYLFSDDLGQKLRMNYYPPCPEPDQVIGLTPHSDATGLTILLQVNEVEGLQIKKNGKWVSVKPLNHAFVVNIGDMLELINHGMDSSFLDKVKSEVQDFFNLPMEEKRKLRQRPGDIEGFGQAFVVSEEQKLDWGDMFLLTMQPFHLRKPHLFPKLPPPFRDALEKYSSEVKSTAKILLANMARALKIKPDEMEYLFGDDLGQKLRMNYYPPCPEPDQVYGLTPHSDATGLTILLQVNEVEGLQIKKNGKWVSVKPLPNAFVVNIGDMLEMITNGTYKSIEHRGVVNSEKERLSMATFHNTGTGKEIGPLRSLVKRQKGACFRTVTPEEYFKGLASRGLDGKAFLDVWRI